MTSRLRSTLRAVALAAAAALPPALAAQPSAPPVAGRPLGPGTRGGEPRLYGGLALNVAQPVHEFRAYVANGVGLAGHGLYRFGAAGAFALRADLGFVTYGRESRRVRSFPAPGASRPT